MSDKNKHFRQSFYSEKAAGYVIYSQFAITMGYGYYQDNDGIIAIKGLNTSKTSLGTTVVSQWIMENILLKDEHFLKHIESGLLYVKAYNKGKEKDEYYLLSEEGVQDVIKMQNIVIDNDIEEKEVVLAREKNKKPTTAKMEMLLAGEPISNYQPNVS